MKPRDVASIIWRDFRYAILAYLFIMALSWTLYFLGLIAPSSTDVLRASRFTPWGVITSLFVHRNLLHNAANTVGLLGFVAFFIAVSLQVPDMERRRRSVFLVEMVFPAAILTNVLWVVLAPGTTAGASGLAFAVLGVSVGYVASDIGHVVDRWLKMRQEGSRKLGKKELGWLFMNLYVVLVLLVILHLSPGSLLGGGQESMSSLTPWAS